MENKKYSMLIVALYCYTGHIKNFINHLKDKNPLIDITVLTNKPEKLRESLSDKQIKLVCYDVSSVNYIKISWFRHQIIKYKQCRFFSKFCKHKRYDIINIHFPNKYMSYVYKYLRSITGNIVITPWGSDVLRKPRKDLKQLSLLYKKSDYVTSSTNTPLGKKILQEFKVSPEIMVGNCWGSDVIDYAIKFGESITIAEAKKQYGLSGRYVITCGYNGIYHQRHKDIITAIGDVKDRLPVNLTLLFPMTYLKRDIYMAECQQECKKKDLDAVFLTEYMSIEDVYKLRKATDMFVHIQTTDADSSTIKEYILCDKKIVHGSWIRYEDLENYSPLFYFPVDNLNDLGEVIVKAYNSDNIKIPQGIIDYVKKSGWDNKATLMNDFFMSIV